jgi:hypothetical protein
VVIKHTPSRREKELVLGREEEEREFEKVVVQGGFTRMMWVEAAESGTGWSCVVWTDANVEWGRVYKVTQEGGSGVVIRVDHENGWGVTRSGRVAQCVVDIEKQNAVDFAGVVVGVERVERQEDETVDGSRVVPEKMWK